MSHMLTQRSNVRVAHMGHISALLLSAPLKANERLRESVSASESPYILPGMREYSVQCLVDTTVSLIHQATQHQLGRLSSRGRAAEC